LLQIPELNERYQESSESDFEHPGNSNNSLRSAIRVSGSIPLLGKDLVGAGEMSEQSNLTGRINRMRTLFLSAEQ
jgi:hypothetical protein